MRADWLVSGLMAGVAGSAATDLANALGIGPSVAEQVELGVRAIERLLKVSIHDEARRHLVGELAHWGYGTAWGLAGALLRGLLRRAGVESTVLAIAVHGSALFASELGGLPLLGIRPPLGEWPRAEIGDLAINDALYAIAAGLAAAVYAHGCAEQGWPGASFRR